MTLKLLYAVGSDLPLFQPAPCLPLSSVSLATTYLHIHLFGSWLFLILLLNPTHLPFCRTFFGPWLWNWRLISLLCPSFRFSPFLALLTTINNPPLGLHFSPFYFHRFLRFNLQLNLLLTIYTSPLCRGLVSSIKDQHLLPFCPR